MDLQELVALIEQTGVKVELNEKSGQVTLASQDLVAVCDFLWRNPNTYFDSLSCVTAIDLGVDVGQMEVIYTLYSIPYHVTIHVRVVIDRDKPEVPSLS